MTVTTTAQLEMLLLSLQEQIVAAGVADALVILRPQEMARLIVEARTQGYERGRVDALADSLANLRASGFVPLAEAAQLLERQAAEVFSS